MVDKEKGEILVQEDSDPEPRCLESLLICSTKLCDAGFIDRNYCFRVGIEREGGREEGGGRKRREREREKEGEREGRMEESSQERVRERDEAKSFCRSFSTNEITKNS